MPKRLSKLELAALYRQNERSVAMLTFALYFPVSLAISLLQDSIGIEFGDQGRKLLGGFAVAVVVAIVFTVIKFRRRDKHPPPAFISVTSCTDEDATAKPAKD